MTRKITTLIAAGLLVTGLSACAQLSGEDQARLDEAVTRSQNAESAAQRAEEAASRAEQAAQEAQAAAERAARMFNQGLAK
ncbi:MAG: hypothetical protein RID91_19180 [Azospirillaceae bacterium]